MGRRRDAAGTDRAAVAAAFADWRWVPEGSTRHPLPGGDAVRYPDWIRQRLQVLVTPAMAEHDPHDLLDRVRDLARSLDEPTVLVHVAHLPDEHVPGNASSTPLEAAFTAAGAEVAESLARLVLDLGPRKPTPGSHALEVRAVLTEDDARALDRVDTEVFDTVPMTQDRVAAVALECSAGYAAHTEARAVAWRDRVPVGSGGLSMAGEVARLWGGATVPHARRTGVYTAVLHHRLALARAWGGRLAVVKGRVETSAPILLALGFERFGSEVTYRWRVSP